MYIIKEKIYGNMATVFHRTSVSDLVNKVYTEGFKPGYGDFYGKGFYATYELESQQKSNMEFYGNIIVKFAVPIENFFIFDYEEFVKSPQYKKLGKPLKDSFLKAQLDYFNIKYDKYADILFSNTNTTYSSKLAYIYYQSIPNFTELCRGLIFTGQKDGHVLVCYDTRIIIPLGYSTDEGQTFNSVELNKEYLKKVSVIKSSNYELPPYKPEEFGIKKYEFTKDGFLDVFENVYLEDAGLTKIPFKFGHVYGNFDCSYNNLTSLKGAPREVTGHFFCEYNKLQTLEYAPLIVGADFMCHHNNLITLEGAPNEVEHNFKCSNNKLTSLKGAPKIVKGSFNCSHNFLTLLQDGPTKVQDDYLCDSNNLISLRGSPKTITGLFDCSNNKLESLEGAPEKTNDFYCINNAASFTKEDVLAVSHVIGRIITKS